MTIDQFRIIYRALLEAKTYFAVDAKVSEYDWQKQRATEALGKVIAADAALEDAYIHPEAV